MALHWFTPPVPVRGEQTDMTYIVSNVEAAAEHLLTWTKRGPKWNQAVRTCMNALVDQATPEEARRCFRLAAIEAGRLRAAREEG
ncbi:MULTISPECIES: DUF982 domain-containing protein [unclassified Mesorhizobium]|uniref:DUF982 domain-containing protein n=1 Tax=unclassified Mesorhizobium TaxID=325217 RepID=UPI00112E1B15|nr:MULTISPECIES: DUF982 domain-containing protein [unclassified Mesorhizobium]MBZ9701580.1 DUF982 domain-containing protein [Mesorhizobium sp. CO1-1-3]MBZ9949190.1 DUF982 domain-containing protein [Mesorhizobium sp. BR1-1-11]TPI99612.1 DUF982 domain-containing protein [Mesorhizobium sp. B2-8-1]